MSTGQQVAALVLATWLVCAVTVLLWWGRAARVQPPQPQPHTAPPLPSAEFGFASEPRMCESCEQHVGTQVASPGLDFWVCSGCALTPATTYRSWDLPRDAR